MTAAARPDDREVRDVLVADYQRFTRSRGLDPALVDLERIAIADLEITDKVNAEAKPRPAPKPALVDPNPPPVAPTRAQQLAKARGYTFGTKVLPAFDAPKRKAPPLLEKPTALAKRMAQMCQQVPGTTKSASLADRQYVYPALAKAVLTEHADFTHGRRNYRGLSSIDRQRMYWRAIEDIADRSTGVLGPWWVK